MSTTLHHIVVPDFQLASGKSQEISVSYQLYGQQLHTAPIILVTHALTGNSNVTNWWPQQIGPDKVIDTNLFTVLCIDIPGNGYDNRVESLIYNYQDWLLADVATVFMRVFKELKINFIHLGIGGSIGGALLWELLVQAPELLGTIVPIAADWKATDWLVACCHVQQSILQHSTSPLEDARQHAMTFYRSPQGLRAKFNRSLKDNQYAVKAWLDYHGNALKERFTLPAYVFLNHLLSSTNAARLYKNDIAKALKNTQTAIELIAIDSDGFFLPDEDRETYNNLKTIRDIDYHEIASVHGHDAFLIEHDQVEAILCGIIKKRIPMVNSVRCNENAFLKT